MNIHSSINKKEVIQILSDLVSINSINPAFSDDAPGESKVAEYIEQFFDTHNIAYRQQIVSPDRHNVIGIISGKDSSTNLAFESHMDVVSTKGMTIPPFEPEIHGNRLYGRGACDTKASMAGMLYAMKFLAGTGTQPSASIVFIGAVDEEYGQSGIKKIIESELQLTAAVIGEPTELDIVRAHNGCVRWNLKVKGKAAHTSKPELGINAVVKMNGIIQLIEQNIQPLLKAKNHPLVGNPVLTISMIEGGTQVNFVPDTCTITLDRRVIPGENKDIVWDEFNNVLDSIREREPELSIEMEEPLKVSKAMETPENEKIVRVSAQSVEKTIGRSLTKGAPYGTDASPLFHAGVPSVVLGPGSVDQAHTADEWVDIDQVVSAAEMYIRIMLDY
jgi:acetylornithine deacetylase